MSILITLRCPVHPKYKAVRPPNSTHPRCRCEAIWSALGAIAIVTGSRSLTGKSPRPVPYVRICR